jgi:hypothetical protein
MEALFPLLVLACPLAMVAMMLWMHRSKKGGDE